MAKTIITTNVPAGGTVRNVLANSNFQFADNPGPDGLVETRVSVVSDVVDNEYELNVDKDFVAREDAAQFVGPPRQNQDPFQIITVTAGSQVIINLINNSVAAQDFRTLVEYTPV